MNYYGLPCSIYDLNFDIDVISHVILDLKRGKAADIYSLTAEHLLYSHPILSLILTKLFRLIVLCRYIPVGFKHSYIVPIPKLRDSRMKAVTCDDFRSIAISPICLISSNIACWIDSSMCFLLLIISLVLRKVLDARTPYSL